MSHTPGPWKYTPSSPSEGFECFWITATPSPNQEKEVATVSGPQTERNEANSRLVAAAPDLLAMCEEVLATVLTCRCDEAYTSRKRHEPNSACYLQSSMEGVIKKAKGESK